MRSLRLVFPLCLLLAVLYALAAPKLATADPADYPPYPGQRPAPDVQPMVERGLADWRAQGVDGCPGGVTAEWADYLGVPTLADSVILGRAWPCTATGGRGTIYLLAGLAADDGCGGEVELRPTVMHELGHALGLTHEDEATYPIMHARIHRQPCPAPFTPPTAAGAPVAAARPAMRPLGHVPGRVQALARRRGKVFQCRRPFRGHWSCAVQRPAGDYRTIGIERWRGRWRIVATGPWG